jgi:hypothetical protein
VKVVQKIRVCSITACEPSGLAIKFLTASPTKIRIVTTPQRAIVSKLQKEKGFDSIELKPIIIVRSGEWFTSASD